MEGGGWLSVMMALGVIALVMALALAAQRWRYRRKESLTKARSQQ